MHDVIADKQAALAHPKPLPVEEESGQPRQYRPDAEDVAQAVARQCAGSLAWDGLARSWRVWTGTHWQADKAVAD